MKPLGSAASVIAAMREDAAAELERIEREADERIAALEKEPGAETLLPDREERIAAALRAAREAAAREDLEDSRGALLARERWFEQAAEEGRKLLAAAPDRAPVLFALARDALECLPPGARTLHVAPEDVRFFDAGALERLEAALGEPAAIDGGCIARSGRLSADNSFSGRARRLEGRIRVSLGKLYAEGKA